MSGWIKVCVDDIASYQAGAIVRALQTAARNDTQGDPVAAAIEAQTLFIRAQIASGNFAVDRDPEKIPAELKPHAIALIVEYAKTRLPSLSASETETRLSDAARSLLSKIAEGKIKPSPPDDPEAAAAAVQSSSGAKLVRPGRAAPKREDYSGL